MAKRTLIFLDIKEANANDTVNHDILLQKMKAYGISDPLILTSKTGYNTVTSIAPLQTSGKLIVMFLKALL